MATVGFSSSFFLRNPNESLFAAESFEDLTNDAIAKIDGQCSSRTLSVCSTGMIWLNIFV